MDNYRTLHTKYTYWCYYCNQPCNCYIEGFKSCIGNIKCSTHGNKKISFRSGDNINIVGYIYG
jgi:hypothetical protein